MTQSARSSAVLKINPVIVQGSNLGPVMFTLLTNDISCYPITHAAIVSYTDDTKIIHSAPPTPADLIGGGRGCSKVDHFIWKILENAKC